jgi:oligopeptide transport system substrate-binding protein
VPRGEGAARAVALTLALGFVACSPSREAPSDGGPEAIITPSPAPSLAQGRERDVLRVAIRRPSTLDPMRAADPGSVLVVRQLFEGLTRWDDDENRIRPAAARSWSIGDGGRTFTFHLRRGMTFHNGAPVTARDFRFAFDRIARKRSGSDIAYTLERVRGFDAVNRLGSRRHLAGIETPQRLTLVMRLSTPWRAFPAVLAHPGLVPLQAETLEDYDEFLAKPIGNGPFMMRRSWHEPDPIALRAFPDAFARPAIDGIRFIPFADASVSWIPFTQGRLDVVEVPSDEARAARRIYGDRGYRPLVAGTYFGLNLDGSQLSRLRLRVAINRAIDRETIARDVFDGTLEPARGIVPRGMPGFARDRCSRLCSHSPRAARRLVASLPRAQRRVSIQFNRDRLQARVARAVAGDLRDAGLRVTLDAIPLRRYLERLSRGDASMYRFGWIAEYPDPSAFLTELFASRSADNHSGFASRRVDELLRRARAARSRPAAARLYRRAEEHVLARAPVVPIGSFTMRWVAQPWVERASFDVLGGFDAASLTLDRS